MDSPFKSQEVYHPALSTREETSWATSAYLLLVVSERRIGRDSEACTDHHKLIADAERSDACSRRATTWAVATTASD